MEMTITRALTELKLLDKRIQRSIQESVFGGFLVGKKPMTGFVNQEEIEKTAKANYQSATDLIKRRNAIKSAIVQSNAVTYVVIGDKSMTVAEAIERKTSIDYEKMLLNKLKNDYTKLVRHVDSVNEEVKNRLDKHLETLYGKDGKVRASENEELIKPFLQENEAKFVDPLNLKAKIEELTIEIEEFEAEVDFVLSESNTIKRIYIED